VRLQQRRDTIRTGLVENGVDSIFAVAAIPAGGPGENRVEPSFVSAGGFVLSAEASGADVDFSLPSLYHNRSSLDIGQPSSRGMLFRMAHTATKLHLLPTDLTLHRDFSFYLNLPNDNTTASPGERAR
jgi:hypothetical protein